MIFALDNHIFFIAPTVFLCQQTTCLNIKLLFADLLFEP